tara:strand:- start:1576 stop:1971 length:396 start_codon:yes stop_codon:yes gene_type:complete
MKKRPIKLRESDIMNIVKRVIKEQVGPQPLGNLEAVSAKGCCSQLYLYLDFINSHVTNINNIYGLIQQAAAGEIGLVLDAGQMDIFNNSIAQAELAIESASSAYNDLNSTGCCKSLTGKSAEGMERVKKAT